MEATIRPKRPLPDGDAHDSTKKLRPLVECPEIQATQQDRDKNLGELGPEWMDFYSSRIQSDVLDRDRLYHVTYSSFHHWQSTSLIRHF